MRSIGKEIVETATQHIWTMLLREQARHPYHLTPDGLVVVDKGDIAALIDAALSDKDQQIKELVNSLEQAVKDLFKANKELKIYRGLGAQNLPKESPRDALYEQRFIVRAPNVTKEES